MTVRIALVGAGSMGTLHSRVVAESPDATLVQIVDPDPVRGGALAAAHGATWSADGPIGECDAVIVAAPTGVHMRWASEAIGRGLPVLVEKPLSTSADEAEAMVAAASAAGVPLMCGFLERFNPAVHTALGIVPEPVHLQAVRHSPFPDRIRTGVSWDTLIHDVDLVVRVAGVPELVAASSLTTHPRSVPGAENVVEAILTYPGRMVAALSASHLSQRKVRRLTLADNERVAEVDLLMGTVTVYRHVMAEFLEGGDRTYRQQTVVDVPFIRKPREPLAAQFEHFLALVRGEADAAAERESLLEPHRVVSRILDAGRVRSDR